MAEVEIIVKAVDQASGVLNNTSEALLNTGNIAASVAAIGFAALASAVAATGAVLADAVAEASESELAIAKLNQVLIATDGASGMTSKQLQDLASSLQSVTRYTDEEIIKGESMLLTFRNIGADVFPQATQAMLDMGTMFGSVDSAAIQLGKALNDPINGLTALKRIGVDFNDTQKTMIEQFVQAGDIESAQKVILKELADEFGNVSQAMGDTFAGRIDRIKNMFSDLMELLGGPVLMALSSVLDKVLQFLQTDPVIQMFTNFFTTLNKLLQDGAPPLSAFAVALSNLTLKFPELQTVMQPFIDAFLSAQRAIDDGGAALDAFVAGITSLAGSDSALAGIAQSILAIRQAFENGGLVGVVQLALSSISITDIIAWMDALDASLATAIKAHDWKQSGDAFGNTVANIFAGIFSSNVDKALIDGLDSEQSQAVPAIVTAITDWFFAATGSINWEDFKYRFTYAFNNLEQIITDAIRDAILPSADAIQDAWTQIWAGIDFGISLSVWMSNIKSFVTNVINYFKALLGISSPSTVFIEIGKDIVRGLVAGLDSMVNWAIGVINGIVATILSPFAPILDLLGINTTTSTGTIGSRNMGGTTAGTGTTTGTFTGGTVVNQYFAGATINVGSWDEISYDCIYPNPFVSATSGQLSGAGIGIHRQ